MNAVESRYPNGRQWGSYIRAIQRAKQRSIPYRFTKAPARTSVRRFGGKIETVDGNQYWLELCDPNVAGRKSGHWYPFRGSFRRVGGNPQ